MFTCDIFFTVDELEAAADEGVSKGKKGRYESSITFLAITVGVVRKARKRRNQRIRKRKKLVRPMRTSDDWR